MKRVLIYVHPGAEERDLVVTWAADLVEALTAPAAETIASPEVEVGVVADTVNCLEIGLVTLGRGIARTVEGGERDPSPVMLFPFRPPNEDRSTDVDIAYECLRELADLGAVEGIRGGNQENDVLPDADTSLRHALASGDWETMVTLGDSNWYRATIADSSRGAFRTPIVAPIANAELRERIDVLVRQLQPEGDDDYGELRRSAVQNAVQFAGMLDQLGINE
jgi:hypothetical protein